MFDFFDTIVSFFETLFNFFVGFVDSLITFYNAVADAITIPLALQGLIPDFIASMVLGVTALGVVKVILGR